MGYCLLQILLLSAFLLHGCARGTTTAAPPEIRYGEDTCTECNMIISDPRYAAGYAYEISAGRYESLAFDDIGDLLAHLEKHHDYTVIAWYVHDYTTEEWVDATTAYYVLSDEIHSPMGHGIAAHATRSAADALAQQEAGLVLDWQGLQAQVKATAGHNDHRH